MTSFAFVIEKFLQKS